MKDMDKASYILGVKSIKDRSRKLIALSQEPSVRRILQKFEMYNCKPTNTPIFKGQTLNFEMCLKTPQDWNVMKWHEFYSLMLLEVSFML